jgi:hypothetical protein
LLAVGQHDLGDAVQVLLFHRAVDERVRSVAPWLPRQCGDFSASPVVANTRTFVCHTSPVSTAAMIRFARQETAFAGRVVEEPDATA